MPKLTRYLQKIFANNSNEVGVFGTGVDKETSKNVETLQSADYENGWSSAIITNKNYPIWQEMDGVQYGLSYQLKYLLQSGIPEWLSTETYYTNDYCRVGSTIYYSLQDNNINHNPALNDGYWTPLLTSNRSIGEIIPSTIPLTEAGLHLLDGALISSGMYADFVTYMANLTATAPEVFTTEANWQAAVTLTGVCDKFVYDSVNNTVRLPKYGNQIITSIPNTVPVKGNGYGILFNEGTNEVYLDSSFAGNQRFAATYIPNSIPAATGSDVSSFGNSVVGKVLGLTTNGANSGLVTDVTNLPLNCYYYIVVATSTKTDIQVDIDEIATDLNGKADVDLINAVPTSTFGTALNTAGIRTVVTTYVNGTAWYRIWSDGWKEQGSFANMANGSNTVPLLINFSNTNYNIQASLYYPSGTGTYSVSIQVLNTDSFKAYVGNNSHDIYWYACGY